MSIIVGPAVSGLLHRLLPGFSVGFRLSLLNDRFGRIFYREAGKPASKSWDRHSCCLLNLSIRTSLMTHVGRAEPFEHTFHKMRILSLIFSLILDKILKSVLSF